MNTYHHEIPNWDPAEPAGRMRHDEVWSVIHGIPVRRVITPEEYAKTGPLAEGVKVRTKPEDRRAG